MKVAILIQHLATGGIQRIAVDEANEFIRRGDEVFFITFLKPSGPTLTGALRVPTDHQLFIEYPRMRSLAGRRELIATLKRISSDLVITHHSFANTVGRIAAHRAGITHVLSFEHTTLDHGKTRFQLFIDRRLQTWCKKIVAVSEPVKQSLIAHGIDENRIAVVANGVDLSRFKKTVPGTGTRFGFVGRLVYDKGADVALLALAQTDHATLTIVGDGPERARLQAEAKEFQVENRVRFLGMLEDTAPVYDFDCLLLPSRREGFGIVAVEAFASGVPVIASERAGEAGVIQDGANGVIIPLEVSALSRAMRLFMSDAELRERLGRGAAQNLERYAIATHVDQLLAL